MTRAWRWLACVAFVSALPLGAQETLKVTGPEPALVQLGDEAVVELEINGSDTRPGRLEVPQVPGLRIEVDGPSESSWVRIINGRRASGRTTTYRIVLEPAREGRFEIPSFTFNTGTQEQTVRRLILDCEKSVTGSDKGFIEITPLPDTVYVGEPVEFVFDYGIDGRISPNQQANGLIRVFLNVPWFANPDGMIAVEGVDEVEGERVVTLAFNGEAKKVAYTPQHRRNGRIFHRFTFTKTLMPTRAGTVEIADPTLKYEFGGSAGFFDRRPPQTGFAYGDAVTLEVRELPTTGRPANFGNAVGRFSVEAAASARRVRVGDSIKLILTIRGRGNHEFLEIPALGELEGLHLLGQNENRSRGSVVVEYDLTPLREDVVELPSIEWSYFDTSPGVERYVAVKTDAIPINVEPAAEGEGLAVLPGEDDASITAGVDDIFDMKPVDAVSPLPLKPPPARLHVVMLVLAPWVACVGFAFLWGVRRRRRADVRGRRAAGAKQRFRSLLRDDPLAALTAYLADRLDVSEAAVIGPDLADRLVDVGVEDAVARDVQAAIDSGTAARYGGGTVLGESVAIELVAKLETVKFSLRRASAFVICALALAAGLGAQRDARIAAGEQAYRDGDYAQAAREFAAAAEREDVDRRVFYNLGNSLYRDGQYARALVAYERARLAMPRDPELLANIAVVERKLDLARGEGEPFVDALAAARDQLTSAERLLVAVLVNLLAALALVFGGRVGKWVGGILLVPAVVLAIEVVWLGPARPPRAIVLVPHAELTSEPRQGLEAVMRIRRGVSVELLGESEAWASVRVDGRQGYLPRSAVGVIR